MTKSPQGDEAVNAMESSSRIIDALLDNSYYSYLDH